MDELKGEMNKIKPPTFDGEDQRVLVDTIITPKVAPREGHIVVQAHLLPESIGDLEWMN